MTTTITEVTSLNTHAAGQRLRSQMAAARLSFRWPGVRKTLSDTQKHQAADSFGATATYLSATKKLLDTGHPAFKAVTAVRGRASAYFKGVSLPFPEPGIRLIRQHSLEEFDNQLTAFHQELDEVVTELDRHYDDLRNAARERLGDLFNPADYPPSLIGLFQIEHDYPSVEPPNYLQQLNPELYEQECRRVQQRFEDAVQLAEQAFTEEFAKLVEHLAERLRGADDGKPKVFRDTSVSNLTEFFDRFRELNVRSSEQLDELVDQARSVVQGIAPQQLRDNASLREQVSAQLTTVQTSLDELLVDSPRRQILRSSSPQSSTREES